MSEKQKTTEGAETIQVAETSQAFCTPARTALQPGVSRWRDPSPTPQQGCVLCLSKVTQEEVDPLREAYSISTFLQCNSPPSELPIDNNQLPVMFLSTYCVSGTVLGTSHTLSHLILIITFSYSHILENETEAQRG